MSEDLSKMSLEELRVKLAALEAEQNGKPNFLIMIASTSDEKEALDLYINHQIQIHEMRGLDFQIYALKKAIAAE